MKAKMSAGATLLVIGIILLQLSLSSTLYRDSSLDQLAKALVPPEARSEMYALMGVLGSILVALGLILAFKSTVSRVIERTETHLAVALMPLEDQVKQLEERLASLEEKIKRPPAMVPCKFCGAPIEPERTFCPACGKSQR